MSASKEKPQRTRPAVYVGHVEDGHNEGLATFFRSVWSPTATGESVAGWRADEAEHNPADPGVEPPKWIFTRDEVVLGYLGTIPDRFSVGGESFPAYWLKGFQVDPAFRSGPVGFEILRTAIGSLQAAAATVVAPEARRLFEAHGLRDLGVLFNRILPLRPARILARLEPARVLEGVPSYIQTGTDVVRRTGLAYPAGVAVSAALAFGSMLRGRPPRGLRTTVGWDAILDEAIDAVWDEFRAQVSYAALRDARFVRWRYQDGDRYQVVAVWANGVLRGWAVVRRPGPAAQGRLEGLSVATLTDVVFLPQDTPAGLAVVAAAERLATEMGADAVLCSGSHPALGRVLSRRSFLKIPGNVHFMARDADDRCFPGPLESWWLTRGDGQADGAF